MREHSSMPMHVALSCTLFLFCGVQAGALALGVGPEQVPAKQAKEAPASKKSAPLVMPQAVSTKLEKYLQSCEDGTFLAVRQESTFYLTRCSNNAYVLLKTLTDKRIPDIRNIPGGFGVAPDIVLGLGAVSLKPWNARWTNRDGFTVKTFKLEEKK